MCCIYIQIPHIHNPSIPQTSLSKQILYFFLTARGRFKEYPSIPRATQENLELNPPPHFLDSIKNKKTRSWADTEL